MGIVIKLFFALCFSSLFGGQFCFFKPPNGWDAQLNVSAFTKIVYIAPEASSLARVNFAIEPLPSPLSLADYVSIAKSIHESYPQQKWRDLGPYTAGTIEGRLTEIEIKREEGDLRQMQFIFVKNQTAYMITASALKSVFGKYYSDFQSVLKSVQMTPDLFDVIPSEKQKLRIVAAQKIALAEGADNNWAPFEKLVMSEFNEMGSFWQYLVLEDTVKQKGMLSQ